MSVLCPSDIAPGDILPDLSIAITTKQIVATAIASRDYQDVHHDKSAAQALGSPDIFMNILTTNGYVGRYVTDWAGPFARLTAISIKLGAPNFPGDTMTLSGVVTGIEELTEEITVEVRGANSIGDHVTGIVKLVFNDSERDFPSH